MNTAGKIYAASTFHEGEVARLAEELATRIEDDLAQKPLAVGSAIGSVRELSERYGVGREKNGSDCPSPPEPGACASAR